MKTKWCICDVLVSIFRSDCSNRHDLQMGPRSGKESGKNGIFQDRGKVKEYQLTILQKVREKSGSLIFGSRTT